MNLQIDGVRQAILDGEGHMLVRGGPGSGKTTVALLKAKRRFSNLKPGQEILFLSFSRAAIRQIQQRCITLLNREERSAIDIRTYHAFCMDVLRSHGRLISGKTCRFMLPGDERIAKSTFKGNWEKERSRRASADAVFCFDHFARGTAALLETSNAVRNLYGAKYPFVIVDEFQDTDDDQWRVVQQFARVSDLFCLADPEQRIFEYRANIDPKRIDALRGMLHPAEYDLGSQNHRSPNGGILDFGDAVLRNQSPLPKSNDVRFAPYYPREFESKFHAVVIWAFSELKKRGVAHPSVAVLCRSNAFLSTLSLILNQQHTYKNQTLNPVVHDVVWDSDLSAAAAATVASIMEWPNQHKNTAVSSTLALLVHFCRLKNAEQPSNSLQEKIRKCTEAVTAIGGGKQPRLKAARELLAVFDAGVAMSGDPVEDWKRARAVLQGIKDLSEVYREARMVRLFGARDALATGLSALWLQSANYAGAARLVKQILDRERLISSDRDSRGCILMTIHKCKGKEFDGIVLVEGWHKSPFFDQLREKYPWEGSRRLLRVAITRARSLVIISRPFDAPMLISTN